MNITRIYTVVLFKHEGTAPGLYTISSRWCVCEGYCSPIQLDLILLVREGGTHILNAPVRGLKTFAF